MLTDLTYLPDLRIDVKFESIFLEFQSEGTNFKTFEKKGIADNFKVFEFHIMCTHSHDLLQIQTRYPVEISILWKIPSCGENFHYPNWSKPALYRHERV